MQFFGQLFSFRCKLNIDRDNYFSPGSSNIFFLLKIPSVLFILMLLMPSAFGQELRTYRVTCDLDEFQYILDNALENIYINCQFEYNDSVWVRPRLRIRGDSSREYNKKSYKINFVSEQRFFGRDKINLVSEYTDPSFSREYLTYDIFRRACLYGSNAWYAKLYINGNYMGLYLDVEQVDEFYLSRTDLENEATIYKADLDSCMLASTDEFERNWSKKTNEESGFYDLQYLVEWLDTTPDTFFYEELAGIFDRENLARHMAVNALIGNQSTYYHNYFLIHEHCSGLWYMLPWDIDKSYSFWNNSLEPPYYRSGSLWFEEQNVLIRRCWRDSRMRSLIISNMREMMDSIFIPSYYSTITANLEELLYDAVDQDTYKQFTTEEFLAKVENIVEQVSARRTALTEALNHYPLPFDLRRSFVSPNGVFFCWDKALVSDESDVTYRLKVATNIGLTQNLFTYEGLQDTFYVSTDLRHGIWYWGVEAMSPNGLTRSIPRFGITDIWEDAFHQGSVVSGVISQSTTWTSDNSPVHLPEGLTVEAPATLTIEPGVVVAIGPGQVLKIEGNLEAVGTEEDSIYFIPLDPVNPWAAIFCEGRDVRVDMQYVSVTGGVGLPGSLGGISIPDTVIDPGWMIMLYCDLFELKDALLTHGVNGGIRASHTDLVLERVIFKHLGAEPILSHGGDKTIRDCEFSYGPLTTGAFTDCMDLNWPTNVEISGCRFYYGIDDIIDMDHSHTAIIDGNYIYGAGDKGLSLGGENRGVIVTNNIIMNCNSPMTVKQGSIVRASNNVFAFNHYALATERFEAEEPVLIQNCVFWRNDSTFHLDNAEDVRVIYSFMQEDSAYPGEGNLTGNPRFFDADFNNFRLLPDSPLIDAGFGTGHPELDRDGAQRFDVPNVPNTGSGDVRFVDIGVFEFYPADSLSPPSTNGPLEFDIIDAYPNPFNTTIRIEYDLPGSGWTTVEIFNIIGRRVFREKTFSISAGRQTVMWDATAMNGSQIASGIYFLRVQYDNNVLYNKLVLIR